MRKTGERFSTRLCLIVCVKRIYFFRLFYLQLVSIIIFRVTFCRTHSSGIERAKIANKSRFKLSSSSLVYRNSSIHHSPTSFTARCSPDNKFYSSQLPLIFFDTFPSLFLAVWLPGCFHFFISYLFVCYE